jgi:alkanesulfonate monooxygenase SsuD/methylene tetrahydromethanopterin reductase-like flavin-dependent oxidoreductase (luciferase family)
VGRTKTERFGCAPPCLVLDDDREACRFGLRGARFFTEALGAYYFGRPTGPLNVPRDFLAEAELAEIIAHRNAPGSHMTAIVGDPVAARETVARFARAGVDELMLIMQLGTVPHELVMRSIRTFGERVMPHFA